MDYSDIESDDEDDTINAIDLFCGCGGMSYGLTNAGINIIAGIDVWDVAINSYKKNLDHINFLIKKVLFPNESKNKPINYHIDERGNIWLNLDYTAKYPGGPFMNEEILGALTLD